MPEADNKSIVPFVPLGMKNLTDDKLKYPIGRFTTRDKYNDEDINSFITIIESAPTLYRTIIEGLRPEDLLKTYRPGSWNVQQLVHHVADCQLLHFMRMKKALTEPDYKEVTLINTDGWADTADGKNQAATDSLAMIESITKRYVFLIHSLDKKDLEIKYYHPLRKFFLNQSQAIAMTAWHLQHHLEHIKIAIR